MDNPGEAIAFADSHAHLEMVAGRQGEAVLAEVLGTYAASAGTDEEALLLDPGVAARDLGRRVGLVRRLSGGSIPTFLRFAAGLWPSREVLDNSEDGLAVLEDEIEGVEESGLRLAAIGECGLDWHHMEAEPAAQRLLLALHCDLARRRRLPLIIHSREAFADTLEVLKTEAQGLTVLIHCFGYGPEEAKAFLDAGYWISFAGNLTYKKAEPLREALALVPLDRLLLETDAPYMNPEPGRGRPSSPLDIGRTYERAAGILGVDLLLLRRSLGRNASILFPRPADSATR